MVNRYNIMSSPNIPLIEKIITWQGEGCNTGKRMLLVRFKYCNKKCPFCDTMQKMHETSEFVCSINDIINDMKTYKVNNLMITGGEPTLSVKRHDDMESNLDATVNMLTYVPFEYADIETNGCNIEELLHKSIKIQQIQDTKHINISYSPKFFNESDVNQALFQSQYISLYENHLPIIKIVVANELYIKFAKDLINNKIYDPNYVYLMPIGTNDTEIKKSFKDVIKLSNELNCNISGRMHLTYEFV